MSMCMEIENAMAMKMDMISGCMVSWTCNVNQDDRL